MIEFELLSVVVEFDLTVVTLDLEDERKGGHGVLREWASESKSQCLSE